MDSLKDHLSKEFVHYLKLHHDIIVMQDENLTGWLKGNHGKKVWHSIMGRVKELLMKDIHIQVVVLDRFIPTTKLCPDCGQLHKALHGTGNMPVRYAGLCQTETYMQRRIWSGFIKSALSTT